MLLPPSPGNPGSANNLPYFISQLTTAMLNNDKSEQIEMLTKRINDLVDEAEVLGCEGRVEEAQGVMKLCEQLKEERTQLEEVSTSVEPSVLPPFYVVGTPIKLKGGNSF